MPYNFSLLWQPWEAHRFRRLVDRFEAVLPPGAWPNYVLGNHDEPRLASRFGEPQARTAAVLLLTLRGTPTIYYGDELGLTNAVIPPDRQQDPWALRVEGIESRDGCRTPMPWDTSPTAGFSPPGSADPWLPISPVHRARSVTAQLDDPGSLLVLYRRLLAYRRGSEALRLGDYRAVDSTPGTFCYLRSHHDERVLVALNFTGVDQSPAVDLTGRGTVVLSTDPGRQGVTPLGDVVLGPHEGLVVEL